MSKAYSLDFRSKVVSFISKGGKKRAAAKLFDIGEDTIYRWLRLSKRGSLAPKKRTDYKEKVSSSTILAYLEKHSDHTLAEIGHHVGLSASQVSRRFLKLQITRKKSLHYTQKDVQSNGHHFKKK